MVGFEKDWHHFHNGSHPAGHAVKFTEYEKWIRFHSLPSSKRYAENDMETECLLSRQNTLAREVLGEKSTCWMATSVIAESEKELSKHVIETLCLNYKLSKSFSYFPDPDEEDLFDVYAAKVVWETGKFDDVLKAIADDQVRVLWMSATSGAIFAPYDGGVDLILPEIAELKRMALAHSDWLSS